MVIRQAQCLLPQSVVSLIIARSQPVIKTVNAIEFPKTAMVLSKLNTVLGWNAVAFLICTLGLCKLRVSVELVFDDLARAHATTGW